MMGNSIGANPSTAPAYMPSFFANDMSIVAFCYGGPTLVLRKIPTEGLSQTLSGMTDAASQILSKKYLVHEFEELVICVFAFSFSSCSSVCKPGNAAKGLFRKK